jgi:hypothetical protein
VVLLGGVVLLGSTREHASRRSCPLDVGAAGRLLSDEDRQLTTR